MSFFKYIFFIDNILIIFLVEWNFCIRMKIEVFDNLLLLFGMYYVVVSFVIFLVVMIVLYIVLFIFVKCWKLILINFIWKFKLLK